MPEGAGRPSGTLVLLHAFPLNARMWEPQLALARQGWRVLAPHFRGFDGGRGDAPAATVDDYAGDVIDLLDTLHVEQAVFAGLSMGGYVAFAIARLAPRYVQALILADTRSQADAAAGVEGRQRMLATVAQQGTAPLVDEMIPKLLGESTRSSRPDIVERVRQLILSNSPDAVSDAIRVLMTRPDSTPLLATLHCPVLIVVGDEDTLTPPDLSRAMHHAIPGSTLAVLSGAGHLSNLEQVDAFNEALGHFLTHRV